MGIEFCTIVSKYRLHQCIALYKSIVRHMKDGVLHILCIDEESYDTLEALKYPNIRAVSVKNMKDDELESIREKRNVSEYCWTLKPVFLLHILENYKKPEVIVYLDSDLYFFDSPLKGLQRTENWSMLFTTHRVNRRVNGGFAAFKRGKTSVKALHWWKKQCMDWCGSYYDNGKFADQGYLNMMRKLFSGVSCNDMPGMNIAPWNCFKYDFVLKNNKVYVNKCPLIFYHFSGLRLKKLGNTTTIDGPDNPCEVCEPYIKEIKEAIKEIEEVNCNICENFYFGF